MQLIINGTAVEVAGSGKLPELLFALGFQERMIAVAVNRCCIPRREFPETVVQDGDEIEILAPMAGG